MCDITNPIMKLRLRGALVAIFVFCFSVFSFSTPVFADPATDPSTSVTTSTSAEEEKESEDEIIPIEDQPTCADQIGGLAWLVCPGTGFLANVIDGAYNILSRLIEVEPVTDDTDSPFYLIWSTCRKLTNIAFVIIMFLCILSQITGVGISNYGVKRMLPRLLAVIILSNLSFMICRVGIDLSNILGSGIRSIFELIEEESFANGALSADFQIFTASNIVSTFLGIGTAAAVTTTVLANVGGFTGLIWLILPVLLGGVFSIIAAVLIMAGRQALIYILLMISPVAIVCYAMPNLSKWTDKWYQLFMRMLFFYPMFSALYGASRLAGLVVMCSAKNAEGDIDPVRVVLGLAIQVIPLFMSIPLMKMSGTILNKIDGIVRGVSAPAMRSFGRMAAENRMAAWQRQRYTNSRAMHNRLARYLQQRKTDRVVDAKALEAINKDTYERRSKERLYNSKGHLNRRGTLYNEINVRKVENEAKRLRIDNDFDQGFSEKTAFDPVTGKEYFIDSHINRRNARSIADGNSRIQVALRERAIERARSNNIQLENTKNLAVSMRDSLNGVDDDPTQNTQIKRLVEKSFNLQSGDTSGYEHAKQVVLATAIAEKRKVDSDERNRKLELFRDIPAGDLVKRELSQSFEKHDYNSMEAAITVMSERGDQNWILEELEKHSRDMYISNDATASTKNEMMRFQKHLLDSTLPLKKDDVFLAAWAKANMIRRAKHEMGQQIGAFISFKDFINGVQLAEDSQEDARKLSATAIINAYKDGGYFIDQDRTVFDQMLKFKVESDPELGGAVVRDDLVLFREKDIRSGLASGKMDGEQLENALDYFTNGYFKSHNMDTQGARKAKYAAGQSKAQYADYAESHMGNYQQLTDEDGNLIYNDDGSAKMGYKDGTTLKFLYDMLGGMTAAQIASSKSTTFKMINHIIGKFGKDGSGFTPDGYSYELRSLLADQIEALKKPNAAALRDKMNPDIRKILDIR